jgi:hypothetical protein
MVERICPQCQHGNPLDNRFCGRCGAGLDTPQEIAHRQQSSLARREPAIPAHYKQVGKAVALSLATIAAEAGLAWLRRRAERGQIEVPALQQKAEPANSATSITRPTAAPATPAAPRDTVTIWSQRVVQVWEQGNLTRQTVERSIWKREG